jgi:hypothetical protein
MYHVISPDGFPITCQPFASKEEAENSIPVYCSRFKHQGYYAAVCGRIPLEELPDYLEIVPAEKVISFCC